MKTSMKSRARRTLATLAAIMLALFVAIDARAQTSFGKMRAQRANAPSVPETDEQDANNAPNERDDANLNAATNRSSARIRQAPKNASRANEVEKEDDEEEQTSDAQLQKTTRNTNARSNVRNVANSKSQTANAAENNAKNNSTGLGPILGKPVSHKYRAGMMFQANPGGACSDVLGTVPVPMDFPEQKVRTLAEDFPAKARVAYRDLKEGGARQLVFKMRELKPGEPIEATSLFEVTRYPMSQPSDTSLYYIPKQVPNDVKRYLKDGKYMQSNAKMIKSLAKETVKDCGTAWDKVDAILRYVRSNIQYKEVLIEKQMRGALDALRTRDGDCEDMSALFIAMCRALDVPARLVRVPGHCWAEFYLVDADKNGYWFPAQVAGNDRLGDLQDTRVILQKGDAFRLPESPKEETLYVKELFAGKVKENGPDPTNVFIQEVDGK